MTSNAPIRIGHCAIHHSHDTSVVSPVASPIHFTMCGPSTSIPKSSKTPSAANPTMVSAVIRRRTKPRDSFRS